MKLTQLSTASGTSLQGYIETTYEDLLTVFGEPHIYQGDKTTVEWRFETDNGIRFMIYDWKQCKTPLNIYSWHIGGSSLDAVSTVVSIMRQHGVQVHGAEARVLTW